MILEFQFFKISLVLFLICICLADLVNGQQSLPTFTELPPKETTVVLGNQLTLKCSASGTPAPKIVSWLFNDKPVDFNRPSVYLKPTGELNIQTIQKSDAGYYQCVARSLLGGVASEKKRVYVAYFDRLPKPTIEQSSVNQRQSLTILPPTINCQPKPKYIWLKDGVAIQDSDRIHISEEGGLYVSNVGIVDQGTYTLRIENTPMINDNAQYSSQDAKKVQVTVLTNNNNVNEVSVIYSSPKRTVGEGSTSVTLECFITGIDTANTNVVWKKLDESGVEKRVPVSSKYVRKGKVRLQINKPTYAEDNRIFRCIPSYGINNFKENAKDIELVVSAPAAFLTKPSMVKTSTGNSTTLNCTTSGQSSHVKRWYRNGIPLEPKTDPDVTLFQNFSVFLDNLNWEDHGIFQCGAENKAGLNFLQVRVDVKNISVSFKSKLKKQFLYVDSTSDIDCVAVGAPKPVIRWLKGVNQINSDSKHTVLSNGTLVIRNVQHSDAGSYTCRASNSIDSQYQSTEVFVVTPTRISKFPPREFPVQKGTSPILFCEVTHDQKVNYTREWRFNNLPIRSSYYVLQRDGSLRVNHVQSPRDTDIDFSCHIFADDGNFTVSTTLVLKNRPLQPSSPRATHTEPFSLTLNWDAPSDGGSVLTSFILFMKNISMTSYVVLAKVNASETTYTVKNLQAGSGYYFQVAAENKFGAGERSAESKLIETKTLAPSAAPRNFDLFEVGKDYAKLKWEEPLHNHLNGKLLGYNLGYRVAGYSGDDFTVTDIKGAITEHTMTGLPLFTKYLVRVAAYNKAGRGPWTDLKGVETLQGIPTAPPTNVKVSVKNSTTVQVNFTSPPQHLWNGKLTKIVARFWPPEKPENQEQHYADYDQSSIHNQTFYIPVLQPDKEYVLAVAVSTTGGASPGSSTVQFKTTEGKPEQVQDLQVSNTYADAFTVSWNPPLKTGGKITHYIVKYRVFSSGNWQPLIEKGNAQGAVVPNLEPNTKYEVKVAAKTSAGIGEFLLRSAQTTDKPELPKAPSNLHAYAVFGSSIALGWTPGDSGRAVILYYKIEYNNDTDYHLYPHRAKWNIIRNLTKILENPANITMLRPSSIYRFRMTAVNRVGASPVSNVSEDITTGEGIPTRAPTDIIVTAPIQRGLEIKWTAPSRESWNSGSVKYQFLIKKKGLDPKVVVPFIEHPDAQATSYTARGLKMYTLYNITIRLFNDKGFGPWSKPYFYRTSEDYPSGAPRILSAFVLSSTSVKLKWGPVPESQRNGIILGYKVFYNIYGVENTEMFKHYPGNETFEGVIDGLNGYTDYEFRILAYTKVGGRLKGSSVVRKTLEGVPGKPSNVLFSRVTYDSLEVEWDEPIQPNGRIMTYRVSYRLNITQSPWIKGKISIFNPRSCKVNGLVYASYYLFKIEARTGQGWGTPALEYVLVTSDRELPESPVILGIPYSSVRHTSVIVQWRPRFDGNAPIRSYNLQYNKDYSGWNTYKYGIPPIENIPPNINKVEVEHLDYASQYQFRVRANNDIGSSAWSENSKTVTTHQKDPSGAPFNVRVVEKSPNSLTIGWEKPKEFDLSSSIRGYSISWELSAGIDAAKKQSVNENTFQFKITKLKVFSAYEVRVGVFNDFGKGIWSQKYKWRTGEDSPVEAPSNVQVVLQGTSRVRVTWIAPHLDNVRGWALGYKIELRKRGSGDSKRKRRSAKDVSEAPNPFLAHRRSRRSLGPTCTSIPLVTTHLAGPYAQEVTIKNLRKYTRYQITVRVYNSFGDGPASIPTYFTTPQAKPGPPYLLSDRSYVDQIQIDFAEPCETNGKILGYRVRHKMDQMQFTAYSEYNANTRRINIAGLQRSTRFFVELQARTSVGYGQSATIDTNTKGTATHPGKPGSPVEYENRPGILVLKWEEIDNGNVPVERFQLEYKKDGGDAMTFKEVRAREVQYQRQNVVYTVGTLKAGMKYQFRVKLQTRMGVSTWSDWSKDIVPVSASASKKPVHKEIWFIFLLVVIFLILIIVISVCCWKFGCKEKMKYKTKKGKKNGYNMSTFEMAMVNNGGTSDGSDKRLLSSSRSGSLAPSVSSTKKSIAKSASSLSNNSDDCEPLTARQQKPNRTPATHRDMPDDSIVNHYSNDPFHKNWRDSLDKKTKKEILAEYAKRRPSQASVDTLDEKRKDPTYERPRPRPGRNNDINEMRNLARSQPELVFPHSNSSHRPPPPHTRRPGKRPIDQELTRSQPELNRSNTPSDNQVTRAPSFLRATAGDSDDNESLHEVFEREKTKRELALELDNHLEEFYPNTAPPPYDYNGAPPAYSPSDMSEQGSEFNYGGKRSRPYIPPQPPQPRYSDNSDQIDFGRRGAPTRNSQGMGYPHQQQRGPPRRQHGYFSPEAEYSRYQHSPATTPQYPDGPSPGRGFRPPDQYPPSRGGSDHPSSSYHSDHQFEPRERFSPPENAYIDDYGDEDDDGDGYRPDTTVV